MSAVQVNTVEKSEARTVVDVVVSDGKRARAYRLSICAISTTVYNLGSARLVYGKTFFAGEQYQNPESAIPTAYKAHGKILAEIIAEARK